MTMMRTFTAALAFVFLTASTQLFACEEIKTNTVSLGFTEMVKADQDPNKIYQDLLKKLAKISEKYKLENFKISSSDVSLSRSSYYDHYDLYVSAYLEFKAVDNALGIFFKELTASSLSVSTQSYEDCSASESTTVL